MTYDLTILGLGYIGLPMAALAAQKGLHVCGVDIRPDIVETINKGLTHLEEPGLPDLVAAAVSSGHLRATHMPQAARVYVIAVPTPVDHATHRPDMSYVNCAAAMIAPIVQAGDLVILQSTSPVGSTRTQVKNIIERERPDLGDRVNYAYCPERAIPGKTLHEMIYNDRAIGGLTPEATAQALAFYRPLIQGQLMPTTTEAAEMVKLVENASRDVQLAFANELSLVCDQLNLNVWEIIRLANHHPRVNILQPGPGVGGHCIPVDPWFIVDAAPDCTPLMRAARQVNDTKPDWVVEKVRAAATDKKDPVICLLGLAYKENVDDFRESPATMIADKLIAAQIGTVIVVEPFMAQSDRYNLVSLADGVRQADIVVHLTAHDTFKTIPPEALSGKMIINPRTEILGERAAIRAAA